MAIKNKIQVNEYEVGTPTSISSDKIQPLAKAAIKKLIMLGYGIKTSFFLEADYFKDPNGKPDGHFLAIGDSAGLEKEFKSKKTLPNIAYGNLYIEKTNEDDVICFELVPGHGKFKKPADWKIVLKTFKKMLKHDCKLVTTENETDSDSSNNKEENSSKESESEAESATERLERKAEIAEELLDEVVEITQVYNKDLKEKLLRKTTKWLTEYVALPNSEKTPVLVKHFDAITKADKTVKEILQKDQQITKSMDQVFAALEQYLAMENGEASKNLAKKISTAIDKVKPLIADIKDVDLLQECEEIQDLL